MRHHCSKKKYSKQKQEKVKIEIKEINKGNKLKRKS